MKPPALLVAGALGLTACARAEPPPRPPLALDCARGFEALSAAVAAEPGLKLAPAPGEPYSYFNAEDGAVSFVVTRPGAPSHPAVFRQLATPAGMRTTGCAYGDRPGYDRFLAYLRDLARARGRS